MKLSRLFNSLPKKLAASGLIALAFVLPAASMAANTVKIEADTTVANASATNPTWGQSTSAKYNEVVDIQVVYDNDEAADSGKVANNLRVKINIPTTAGVDQTVTTKTSGDNTNTVNGSAKVTLDSANSYLQYIPGTATWKHATSANGSMTTTQSVSDAVVTDPNGLVLENENPCQAGSIQVQARVVTPGVTVDKYVRENGTTNWATSITAKPGDTIQYEIAYHNTGNTTQNNVEFRDQLPKGITYVPGSTVLKDGSHPNGWNVPSDAVVTDGIITGSYLPGAAGYVMFTAKVAANDDLPACGANQLGNIAYVQPQGMNYYWNTAQVNVTKTCESTSTPAYSCDLVSLSQGDNRTVTASVEYTAKDGATFKTVTIDWGDGSTPLTTSNKTAQYSYAKDGTYTVTAKILFSVNGKDTYATNANCAKTVTFTTPTTPTALPNTGAGDVIGVFFGAIVAGTIGYRLFLGRKLARSLR